ncbi:Hypothetical predicted protein [Cloeon dipterum]|nr:Hypothetical predicted protein [Cloeon dipterum]
MTMLKQDFNQQQLACMVPYLHIGLSSASPPFLASCLAVISHLVASYPISETLTLELMTHLTMTKIDSLKYDALSVVFLLMTSQTRIIGTSPKLTTFITTQFATMSNFVGNFERFHEEHKSLNLVPFLVPLLQSALGDCRNEGIFFIKGVDQFLIKLLQNLILDEDQAAIVIRLIFDHLPENTSNIAEIRWFGDICQILESRYPSAFDSVAKDVLSKDTDLKETFHVVISHKGLKGEDGILTVQGICLQLVHPEEAIRASAVRTAAKFTKNAKEMDRIMLQSYLRDRLRDDSMQVVCAVLTLKSFCKVISPKEELFDLLLDLLEYAKQNKWNLKAIAYLVAHVGNAVPENVSELKKTLTILSVMSHAAHHPEVMTIFADTKFGCDSTMIKDIKKGIDKSDSVQTQHVSAIFDVVKKVWKSCPLDFADIVKERLKNKNLNALDLYLLSLLLQGVAVNAHTALHKSDCFQMALQIRSRAKVVIPKNPSFPPKNKAELLSLQHNNLVKNNLFPIHAFTDIITALVREPMTSFASQIADSIQQSLSSLIPNKGDGSQSNEDSQFLKWPTQSKDNEDGEYLKLSISIMATLLELCSKVERSDEEQSHMIALRTFVMSNFSGFESQLHFLSIMWSQPNLQIEDRMRAVIFATSIVKLHQNVKTNITQLHPDNCFVPALMSALCNPEKYFRQVVVSLLLELVKLRPADLSKSYHPLIDHIAQQSDEMIQNCDQLGVALFSALTEDDSVQNLGGNPNKNFAKNIRKCLFEHAKLTTTPRYITAAVLRALNYVKSQECLQAVIPLADRLLTESHVEEDLDEADFEILRLILKRIDENTAEKLLNSKEGWSLMERYLASRLVYDDQPIALCVVSVISRELFESLSPKQRSRLTHLLVQVNGEISNLKATVATVLRKLPLEGDLVAEELKLMIGQAKSAPIRTTRMKVASTEAAAAKATSSENWSHGTVMLEALSDKKAMQNAHLVVPVLFDILKICLESVDDQEYVKQLTLTSLNILLAVSEAKGNTCALDIELIVNSLKSTTNPRTQRETLVLLCHTAHLVPDNLMHHLVSIFTFVGSLVLRHDDEYSLQIITQVIKKVVPAVLKSKGQSSCLENILRVFSDALPDIPSHRRILVFDELMSTVGWEHLWLFLVLVFESQSYTKQTDNRRLDCALEAAKICQLPVLLKMLHNIFQYISVLTDIQYNQEKQVINALDVKLKLDKLNAANLTNPCLKPAADVRKFQIMALDFMSNLLSIKSSAHKGLRPTDKLDPELEQLYRLLMDCLMGYLLTLSHKEASDKTHAKFWSCLLLQGYSVLNKLNMLLPLAHFVAVVQGVLTSTSALDSVKSKTLELLGAKLQLLNNASGVEMLELLPMINVCQELVTHADSSIACKSLFCLRLLISLIGSENLTSQLDILKKLLLTLINLAKKISSKADYPVMANLLLCLAEMTVVVKVHMLNVLPTLIPLTLETAKQARELEEDQSDVVLLASLALLQRLIETLPQFLSSFLQSILFEVCQVSTIKEDRLSPKAFLALEHRIEKIRGLLSSKISLRVLLQPIHDAFNELSKSSDMMKAVKPLMAVLTAKFESMGSAEFSGYIADLTTFFLDVLELRSRWESLDDVEMNKETRLVVSNAEEEVISALVTFVLKLQEPVFKPFFFKLFNWCREAQQELAHRSRCISFYRVTTSLANKLKGLFTIFVPIYIQQAAELLRICQESSNESLGNEKAESFFGPNEQDLTLLLLEWVLKNLLEVFTQDRQRFVKQETFDLIMQPLVDQLENLIGGEEAYLARGKELVSPCLSQFARCMQDDILWKQLHYQILLKTRSNTTMVRLVAIEAIQSFAEVLREDLLPLLPEAIPFIAELLEDEDPVVEKRTQEVARELEKILGEPLSKYF